jgi:hypothetical protein
MGEMGKKLGEMGNGRNGIGRNGNTPIFYVGALVIDQSASVVYKK